MSSTPEVGQSLPYSKNELIEKFRNFLFRTDRPEEIRSDCVDIVESRDALRALDIIDRAIQQKLSAQYTGPAEKRNVICALLRYLPNAIYKVKSQFQGSTSVDYHSMAMIWLHNLMGATFEGAAYPQCENAEKMCSLLTDPRIPPNTLLLFRDQLEALLGILSPFQDDILTELFRKHILPWLTVATQNSLEALKKEFQNSIQVKADSASKLELSPLGGLIADILKNLHSWELMISESDILLLFDQEIIPVIGICVQEVKRRCEFSALANEVFENIILPVQSYSPQVAHLLYQDSIISDVASLFQGIMHRATQEHGKLSMKTVHSTLNLFENLLAQKIYFRGLIQEKKRLDGNRISTPAIVTRLDSLEYSLSQSFVKVLSVPTVCYEFLLVTLQVVSELPQNASEAEIQAEVVKCEPISIYLQIFNALHLTERSVVLEKALLPTFLAFLWHQSAISHVHRMYTVYRTIRKLLSNENSFAGNNLYQAVLREIDSYSDSLRGSMEECSLYEKDLAINIVQCVQQQESTDAHAEPTATDTLHNELRNRIAQARAGDLIFQLAEKLELPMRRKYKSPEGTTVYQIGDVDIYLSGSVIYCKGIESKERFDRISLATLFKKIEISLGSR
ncbi:FAD binding domain protein [Perkinsela sp. CCAP 1560/4]|nr:FAD binding domain protein [Perkinsela sp. CCAP 1560/4]|eukprot:KNH06966.1 FAD binding domain protein [Perkinsela sp. CCAP 1560/4]